MVGRTHKGQALIELTIIATLLMTLVTLLGQYILETRRQLKHDFIREFSPPRPFDLGPSFAMKALSLKDYQRLGWTLLGQTSFQSGVILTKNKEVLLLNEYLGAAVCLNDCPRN